MTKQEWLETHLNQLKSIQDLDGIGGSLAFMEMAEEFYELFGVELLDELQKE